MLKSPEKIVIHTIPDISGNGKCKPYVEIVNGTDFKLVSLRLSFDMNRFGQIRKV